MDNSVSAEDRLKVHELCKSYLGGKWAECRYFNADDDLNPKAVKLLAQKLAKFHTLDVPIPKDNTKNTMKMLFEEWLGPEDILSFKEGVVYEEIQKQKLQAFVEMDLLAEMAWLRQVVVDLNSPVVFSHNDLNRRNILVVKGDENNNQNLDLYLIDFDWSNYMYRGADLGDYFANWCQQELDFGGNDFPDDQQLLPFIDAYITEMSLLCDDSYAKHEINSRETLLKESKQKANQRGKPNSLCRTGLSQQQILRSRMSGKSHENIL
ncbi:unnamed protein product [Oppiella nova]|uniref:Choline kinase n=1 Tax=Oppiella nova TaxID=334625 RepID=A0A7R9M1D4_9ACAR|nr:unnamed protein product [Oppiella nova]CAG2168873.1 unnamed protein product [Oppiella nova]